MKPFAALLLTLFVAETAFGQEPYIDVPVIDVPVIDVPVIDVPVEWVPSMSRTSRSAPTLTTVLASARARPSVVAAT